MIPLRVYIEAQIAYAEITAMTRRIPGSDDTHIFVALAAIGAIIFAAVIVANFAVLGFETIMERGL